MFSVGLIQAQTTEFQLERAVRMFNEQKAYANSIQGKPADSQLVRIEGFWWAAKPLLQDVLSRGTDVEKKTARYFTMILQYEIAFNHGRQGMTKSNLDRMLALETDMNYYADSSLYPLRYQFDQKNYAVQFRNFGPTYGEFIVGLGELLVHHKRATEAVSRLEKGYAFSYTDQWVRYIVCDKLSREYRSRSQPDSASAFTWNKRAIEHLEKMPRSNWKVIRDNKYNGASFFANQLHRYISTRLPLELDGYPLARAAILLQEWGDSTNLTQRLFATSIAAGNRTPDHLKAALRYAEGKNDKEAAARYRSLLASTDPAKSNSVTNVNPAHTNPTSASSNPAPVEAPKLAANLSLEDALKQVVQLARTGKSSLLTMKGARSQSVRYVGDVFATKKLMKESIEEFLVHDQIDSPDDVYWYAWLGEDDDTKFKGRLLNVFESAKKSMQKAFPKTEFKIPYIDWRYFEGSPIPHCKVNLSYYFNSNTGKESVLLYVWMDYKIE